MTTFDVLLYSSAHDVADARLHRVVAALLRRGVVVRVEARGRPQDAPDGAAFTSVAPDVRGRVGAMFRLVRRRATVLVVLDPELAPIALIWRWLRRGVVVVDVHEDYAAVAHDRGWVPAPLRAVVRSVARGCARAAARADVTVVADEHVPPLDGRHRIVVKNIPRVSELPSPGRLEAEPRALYVGDLRPSRGLDDMVAAVMAADGWSLDLVGPVGDEDRRRVETMLAARSATGRVRLHGRLPPAAAWQHAAGAWVGLALLRDTPAFRRAVPTKLYEYLACGVPVIVSDLPPLREFVQRTGGGVVTGDREAVTARLRTWRDDPAQLERYRQAARAWRSGLPATHPFDEMAEVIDRSVATRRKASRDRSNLA